MTLVRPVRARVVTAAWAPRVVSPLHDVLTESERRAVLADNPDSYLHVTSDPVVLGGPPADDPVEGQARAQRRLLDEGAYRCVPEPSVFVYRMRHAGGDRTGVVAGVELTGFTDGRVLGHEGVQEARVAALVRHYARIDLRSELVALFHHGDAAVAEATSRVCQEPALLDFTDAGGVEQTVWRAGRQEALVLTRHLDRRQLYIADGHHRVATALRCWERDGRPSGRTVLCALFPEDQVSVHAFHRRVHGPVAVEQLLAALGPRFDVRRVEGAEVRPGALGLYADGRWWALTPHGRSAATGVAGLDVTLLDEQVLRPLLGIRDGDPRVEFLPALDDLTRAVGACDQDGGVLFTLHPPGLHELVAVAERREVMSPKTTHVLPKPRTGIFLHDGSQDVVVTP